MTEPRLTPNPGTEEALRLGCKCPVIDNRYGRGYRGEAGVFVYSGGCPVHWLDLTRFAARPNGGQE